MQADNLTNLKPRFFLENLLNLPQPYFRFSSSAEFEQLIFRQKNSNFCKLTVIFRRELGEIRQYSGFFETEELAYDGSGYQHRVLGSKTGEATWSPKKANNLSANFLF